MPSMKYSFMGTSVSPLCLVLPISRLISWACSSSLRGRQGSWLVHVPWSYSGICTFISHTSPSRTSAYPSTNEARPARSDLTSVPLQHQARFPGVFDGVVVARPAVDGDRLRPVP